MHIIYIISITIGPHFFKPEKFCLFGAEVIQLVFIYRTRSLIYFFANVYNLLNFRFQKLIASVKTFICSVKICIQNILKQTRLRCLTVISLLHTLANICTSETPALKFCFHEEWLSKHLTSKAWIYTVISNYFNGMFHCIDFKISKYLSFIQLLL